MRSIFQRALLAIVFSTLAATGFLAWADHGHGGGSGGHSFSGHSFSGGHGSFSGHSFNGGHGSFNVGHFDHHGGFNNHFDGGHFSSFNNGHYYRGYPYANSYRPYYRSYYRPYAYFGYPFGYSYFSYPYYYGNYGYPSSYYYSYPSYDYYDYCPPDYYSNGGSYLGDSYANAAPPSDYTVARPVNDVARVEIRLPDPQATIWVEGKEITSDGAVRRFNSPQLDPSRQFTYDVKAAWYDNGKLVTDERRVKVRANAQSLVDFTHPAANGGNAAPSELPPPQQTS